MLRSVKGLSGYRILATDGEIGSVGDFLFDDETWTVRYLVVETGNWLSRRDLLVSPTALGQPDWRAHLLPVSLTREQVEKSPEIDTHPPVSRQQETEVTNYFGWPIYWGAGAGAISPGVVGAYTEADEASAAEAADTEPAADPHLRSALEVIGYDIEASDGDMGHVDDFLIDDEDWTVRHLVVELGTWWPGKKVVIEPQAVREVRWEDRRVHVDMPRTEVRDRPEYDASAREAA
jgi:sporulation protein YlmC with PRC-barrel domain